MTDGAGVPPLAGVAGFESEPFSGCEAGGAVGTGVEWDVDDSLTGVSSLTVSDPGSMMARSRSGAILSVTVVDVADDLRRSLAGVADLLDGAIAFFYCPGDDASR